MGYFLMIWTAADLKPTTLELYCRTFHFGHDSGNIREYKSHLDGNASRTNMVLKGRGIQMHHWV